MAEAEAAAAPEAPCVFCSGLLTAASALDVSGSQPAVSELLCHHKVHTSCLLQKMMADTPEYTSCSSCGVNLLQGSQVQGEGGGAVGSDVSGDETNNVVVQLFHSDETFQADVKKWYKDLAELSKAHNKLKKISFAEQKDYRLAVKPLVESIKELQKSKVAELKMRDEYKSWMRLYRKSHKTLNRFLKEKETHHLRLYHFRRLRMETGFPKIDSYIDNLSAWRNRRMLRFRLRAYF